MDLVKDDKECELKLNFDDENQLPKIGNLDMKYIFYLINCQQSMQECKMRSSEISNGRWTRQEHNKFLEGVQIFGKNWKQISKLVPTRTGSQIRSHAQKHFERFKKLTCDRESVSSTQEQNNGNGSEMIGHSYFFQKICQLPIQIPEFNLWELLLKEEEKQNMALSQTSKQNYKISFISYKTPSKDQTTMVVKKQN